MASRRHLSTIHPTGCEGEDYGSGSLGHPDQVPYVMVWQDLVEDPPKWLKPFIHKPPSSSNSQVLVMETPPGRNQKERGPKTSLSGIILSKPDRSRNGDEASTICAPLAIPSEERSSHG